MTHTEAVLGLDITTSGISVCRYTGHQSTPKCVYLAASTDLGDFTPSSTQEVADALAEKLVQGISDPDSVRLVVLNKLTVENLRADPSGPRRAGLWWSTVRALTESDFPVAEAPPLLSLLRFVDRTTGNAGFAQAHERLSIRVRDTWSGIEYPPSEKFRAASVMYAATGCMALGVPTPIKLTPTREKVLNMMRLPSGVADEKKEEVVT